MTKTRLSIDMDDRVPAAPWSVSDPITGKVYGRYVSAVDAMKARQLIENTRAADASFGSSWTRPAVWDAGTPTGAVVAPGPAGTIVSTGPGRGPSTNVPANPVLDSPQSGLKPRLPQPQPDSLSVLDVHDPKASSAPTVSPPSTADIGGLDHDFSDPDSDIDLGDLASMYCVFCGECDGDCDCPGEGASGISDGLLPTDPAQSGVGGQVPWTANPQPNTTPHQQTWGRSAPPPPRVPYTCPIIGNPYPRSLRQLTANTKDNQGQRGKTMTTTTCRGCGTLSEMPSGQLFCADECRAREHRRLMGQPEAPSKSARVRHLEALLGRDIPVRKRSVDDAELEWIKTSGGQTAAYHEQQTNDMIIAAALKRGKS